MKVRATEGAKVLVRSRNEHTIADCAEVFGRGYWSGCGVKVRFLPARIGTGIRFVRTDLSGRPELPACIATRCGQSLRTVLQSGDVRIEMVEHLLAALYALEIDNCVVEVNAEEMPGLDGSSAGYVLALRSAGLVMQARKRDQIIVDRPMRVGDSENWIDALPSPDGRMHVEYRLDYGPTSPIRRQRFHCVVTPDTFYRELAPARTFVTSEQAEQLQSQGVAAHVTHRDLLIFGPQGLIGNCLRYPDECARHKALDLVGDLSIAGADLIGCFVSFRGGHQLNSAMADSLSQTAACAPARCKKAA